MRFRCSLHACQPVEYRMHKQSRRQCLRALKALPPRMHDTAGQGLRWQPVSRMSVGKTTCDKIVIMQEAICLQALHNIP